MGYTPVFSTVFDGSLCGKWPHTGVWISLLAMADARGQVDIAPRVIAMRLGIPLDELQKCLEEFCAPDPESRTQEFEGRRLVPLDPARPWGWRIVNFVKYREKARKSASDAERVEDGRNAARMATRADPRRPAQTRADPPSDSDSDSDSESSPRSLSSPNTPSSLHEPKGVQGGPRVMVPDPPPPPASGGGGVRARLEPPLMKPEKAPRYVLAARRGWLAAQRAAAELGARQWGDLNAGGQTERWAARACKLAGDDSGTTLERLVRGGYAWWTRNLPAKSENTAEGMLEPERVFEVKNHERFLTAFAELSPRERAPLSDSERARLKQIAKEASYRS